MPWYPRVRTAINAALPFLLPTQAANLALLVGAIPAKRSCCLSEPARADPTPAARRVAAPKHDLLHRLKRRWRFLGNERVDALAAQCAAIPHAVARLGHGSRLGLAVDWTMSDAVLPSGQRVRSQVLRVAVPCYGRAAPLLQLADERGRRPPGTSQNRLEEEGLWAVVAALPAGVRPVALADRGFARADFLAALQRRGLDDVVRRKKGVWLTAAGGRRWTLGEEGLARGQARWAPGVRYGRWHSPPRELRINVALCWRAARPRAGKKAPKEPWYLATSPGSAARAVAWCRRRGWIEQSFEDSKGRFGLDRVQIGSPARLTRLLMALALALAWLALLALPRLGLLPPGWRARVAQRGRPSLPSLALARLDERGDLPAACLPSAP